jgi:polyisoprenoid-binding protein YceI
MAAAGVLTAGAAAPALADFKRFDIDPAHFSVGFMGHHLSYSETIGLFLEASGHFEYDEDSPDVRNVEIVVRSASVFTNHQGRDRHLKSDEFLDAETHPEIIFVSTSAERTGDNTGIVHGDLTIIGVTLPASFEVTLNKAADYPFGSGSPYVIGISARGVVDRGHYGMTYGIDNGWVDDTIQVMVEFEAVRADE